MENFPFDIGLINLILSHLHRSSFFSCEIQ